MREEWVAESEQISKGHVLNYCTVLVHHA